MNIAPLSILNDRDLICWHCQETLIPQKTKLTYMGATFDMTLPLCPACGQYYIPEELAEGKMREVEMLLEDK